MDEAFRVEGRVIEAMPNGTFRVELKNGHRLTAFARGRAKAGYAGLKPGDRVKLQLTPGDLSAGRLIAEATK